jgi:hypothetical protein
LGWELFLLLWMRAVTMEAKTWLTCDDSSGDDHKKWKRFDGV